MGSVPPPGLGEQGSIFWEVEMRGDSGVLGVGGREGELLDELMVGAAVVVMEVGVSDGAVVVVVVAVVEAAGVVEVLPSEPTDPAGGLEDEGEDEGGTSGEVTDDDDNDLDADDLLEDEGFMVDRDDDGLDVHEDDDDDVDDDDEEDEDDNSGLVCNNCLDKAEVGFC